MTGITREGLERSVPFTVRADEESGDGDGLTLDGYAAVFNQETEIDSWEGSFSETIAPGAFRKTIRERTPVMQFDHGRHPLVGSIPIGTIESLREDETGLAVVGRMASNWLMEPVREAISNKTINGMSFRFDIIKEEWRDNTGKVLRDYEEISRLLWNPEDRGPLQRTLKELRVHELGPVVFPAYAGTSVGLRSAQLADWVQSDERLIHECRSALVQGKFGPQIEGDKELRSEVARRILFGKKINVDGPKPLVRGDISRADVEKLVANYLDEIVRAKPVELSKPIIEIHPQPVIEPEELKRTEPSKPDTHVEVIEPLSDGHSTREASDPNFAVKALSRSRRMALILGTIPDEV